MVRQTIWIAVTIGIFFVGIGSGYALFQSHTDSNYDVEHNMRIMQQMMKDPAQRTQIMTAWTQQMRENPEVMQYWLEPMFSEVLRERLEKPITPCWLDPMFNETLQERSTQPLTPCWFDSEFSETLKERMKGPIMEHWMKQNIQVPELREQMIAQITQNDPFMEELRQNSHFMQKLTGDSGQN